jgi:molybdenum cofactor cytidylyltransferase
MQLHHALRLGLDPAHPDVIAIVGGGGKSSTAFRIARDLAADGWRAVVTHTARIAAFQLAWSPAVIEVPPDASHLPLAEIGAALDAHGACLLTGPPVADRRAPLAPHLVDQLAAAAPGLHLHAISIEADGSKMRPAKAPAEHEPVLPQSTTLLAPMLGLDAVGAPISERVFHRAELVAALLGLTALENATQTVSGSEAAVARFTPQQAAALLQSQAGGAKARPPAARLLPIFNKADQALHLLYGRLAARQLAAQGQTSLLAAAGAAGDPVVERWGEVATIILAAGAAARLGRPKQVEPVGGAPLLLRALAVAAAQPGGVYVVTGAHRAVVMAVLDALPARLQSSLAGRLHIVHNEQWATGQASSVHASIRALPQAVEAAIWLPVDQPYLDPALLAQLAAAWRQGADLAAPLADGELRGAPALFDRNCWPALLGLAGDSGGRAILRQHAQAVAAIPADPASLHDIDTAQDLLD